MYYRDNLNPIKIMISIHFTLYFIQVPQHVFQKQDINIFKVNTMKIL